MLNFAALIYNKTPKPNSKTQIRKRAEKREYTKVSCVECGETQHTLYKYNGQYYCKEHRPQ